MPHSLYFGEVVHTRHRPKKHILRYRVFSTLIDIDDIASPNIPKHLFGFNKWAIFSFWEKDFGSRDLTSKGQTLRANIDALLVDSGINEAIEHIELLCYPRILGFVFNPLSVYFCYGEADKLRVIIYEVANTFGERHHYIINTSDPQTRKIEHTCPKVFYVSPFIPMDCQYRFNIDQPGENVAIKISETDKDGALLYAAFHGKRHEFSAKNLMLALFKYPLMTIKVVAAIHIEAIKLLFKGAPVFKHSDAKKPTAPSIVN